MPNPILVLNQTQGIVFPVRPDLESPKGDRSLGDRPKLPRDLPDPMFGDRCDNLNASEQQEQHHISYSVSYFNYTVSTSEDECENVTVSLNRLKIRRSSRERNDKNLKDKDRQA